MPFLYNKENPPPKGLTVDEHNTQVDTSSFPRCSSCHNEIFNPEFYPDDENDMCGPCCTGESDTLYADDEEDELTLCSTCNRPVITDDGYIFITTKDMLKCTINDNSTTPGAYCNKECLIEGLKKAQII